MLTSCNKIVNSSRLAVLYVNQVAEANERKDENEKNQVLKDILLNDTRSASAAFAVDWNIVILYFTFTFYVLSYSKWFMNLIKASHMCK